jgi:hypothetical protein
MSPGFAGPIQGQMNVKTGEWTGKCGQCDAPAKIEMILDPPTGNPPAKK